MNQNVKPTTAAVIILAALLFISLIFWARQESLRVGGPDQMQVDPEGNVYIHISDTLYKLSPSLEFIDKYQLAELGIYDLVGDFSFFANGDMLVRLGNFEPGILESIVRYLRIADTQPPATNRDNEGLYRCNLILKQCSPFGSTRVDFDSAFHLSIDTTSDTVYLSDTGRHKLRKYDAGGNELATSHNGYKFPNQNMLYNGLLLVVDTNHHAIQLADTSTENYGKILDTHSILDASLKNDIWPYSLARVGNRWWVNNMGNNMSHGTVAIYNEAWKFVKTIELPENADPIDFAVLHNKVLITDLDNLRIYQVDYNGQLLSAPLPAEIPAKLAQIKQERLYYENMSNGTTLLFVVFLLGGFIVAIRQARNQTDPADKDTVESLHININDPQIKWIKPNKEKMRLLKFAMAIPLLPVLIIPFLMANSDKDISFTPLAPLALLALLLPIMLTKLFSLRIGTLGELLIIKKSDKEYAAAKSENIFYSDTHILIGKVYIPFNRQQLFFETEQVIKEIMPLLRDANYVKPGQMMNMILKRQKPVNIVAIFFLAIIVLLLIFGSA